MPGYCYPTGDDSAAASEFSSARGAPSASGSAVGSASGTAVGSAVCTAVGSASVTAVGSASGFGAEGSQAAALVPAFDHDEESLCKAYMENMDSTEDGGMDGSVDSNNYRSSLRQLMNGFFSKKFFGSKRQSPFVQNWAALNWKWAERAVDERCGPDEICLYGVRRHVRKNVNGKKNFDRQGT